MYDLGSETMVVFIANLSVDTERPKNLAILSKEALSENPHLEAMRICDSKTDIVCEIMAVATFDQKEDLLDNDKICERAEFFKWNCLPPDFGTCLLAILTQVDYENFMTSIRLTKILRQNAPIATKRANRVE